MKQFSAKKSIQVLAHVLEQYNINHIVISPGSRNAPLSIHFSELDSFHCFSIVDERSAAFVGMGMAKSLKQPVAITCTSGSAAANYYPAVSEAFYQNIPLLVLTADRPTDYVDIFDGQTIRQNNLFQQHSYGDFQLLEDQEPDAEDKNLEIVKKAVELCIERQGPVHINIPLSEPLYEVVSELPKMPYLEKTLQKAPYEIPAGLIADWNTSKRILILTGTLDPSPELEAQLSQLVKNHSAVVLTEANSNLSNPKFFSHIDRYVFNFSEEDFQTYKPDLLITVGQNVVSKKVKQFLRKANIQKHWHVDAFWHPDTYFHLTEKVVAKPEVFFNKLLNKINLEPQAYFNLWEVLRDKKDKLHQEYVLRTPFSDFFIFNQLTNEIPENYKIHFSNSSAIRYAQLFDFGTKHEIYCNRGTSGIDGCTSTAAGFAMIEDDPTLLITGELSFMYDINGLWNKYIPPYFKIIIINNGEGNIFRIIPGTDKADALDEFIATTHHRNNELIAKNFGFDYLKIKTVDDFTRSVKNFFRPTPKPAILEIMTSEIDNATILKDYFKYLKGGDKINTEL